MNIGVSQAGGLNIGVSQTDPSTAFCTIILDEIRYWVGRVLTLTNIQTNWAAGSFRYGAPDTNLVMGFHCDEGTGTALDDYSGQVNDGVLTTPPAWVDGISMGPNTDKYLIRRDQGSPVAQPGLVTVGFENDVVHSNRVTINKFWHAYGGFQDQDEDIALTQNVWTHITNATNDLWTGLEADGMTLSADVMTITNAGDYTGTLSMSVAGLNGKDFSFRVYNVTKAEAMGYHIAGVTTGATSFMCVTLPLYLECDAGDNLRMEVMATSGNDTITFEHAVFYLQYLHD